MSDLENIKVEDRMVKDYNLENDQFIIFYDMSIDDRSEEEKQRDDEYDETDFERRTECSRRSHVLSDFERISWSYNGMRDSGNGSLIIKGCYYVYIYSDYDVIHGDDWYKNDGAIICELDYYDKAKEYCNKNRKDLIGFNYRMGFEYDENKKADITVYMNPNKFKLGYSSEYIDLDENKIADSYKITMSYISEYNICKWTKIVGKYISGDDIMKLISGMIHASKEEKEKCYSKFIYAMLNNGNFKQNYEKISDPAHKEIIKEIYKKYYLLPDAN